MAEAPKLLYIVVADGAGGTAPSHRYTRSVLQSTLQLMGCKARHAFKISRRVFEVIRSDYACRGLPHQKAKPDALSEEADTKKSGCLDQGNATGSLIQDTFETTGTLPFESYKRLTTVVVSRENFLNVTCNALSEYKYLGPNQRADFVLACRIRERKESVTVLLCGTSGCGKSTLSALLGSRLGVTTVISTDSIRHMMRSFADEKQNPLLWASTYHAGECLDPVAVAEAKAKRKAKKRDVLSNSTTKDEASNGASYEKFGGQSPELAPTTELIGQKQMAIDGFKAQSEMVIDSLDRLITAWEDRKESVVVEGVHLSLNFVMGLMKKHPSIIPFMIYIANEDKHMERFAVRAKYMTLDPSKNKYVKYIRNIRKIQEYLCNRADKHLVPKINNTNVDRSVASIHATVFSCLRRREAGEQLYDPSTNTVPVIYEEYRNQRAANSLSSKGMFQLIQRHGSSRHLMALLNTDGSVAKAWPVQSVDPDGNLSSGNGERCVGKPMYGPLLIGKSEPVNLQFGTYGISAWPTDTGGTSNTGSLDESKADGTETGSRYFSSCCTSPRMSDGPAKELKEDVSVAGSEEEPDDDPPDADTDEDLSDRDNKEIHHETEGSVDEDSTKSDEEYDDLAIRDGQGNGYWSDEEEPSNGKKPSPETLAENNPTEDTKYQQNLDLFLKLTQPSSFYVLTEGNTGSMLLETSTRSKDAWMRKRSLSDSSQFQGWTKSITEIGSSGLYSTSMFSLASER